jgi:hypothetical protein
MQQSRASIGTLTTLKLNKQMLEITDYKSLFKYGDMKKIMEVTGYSRYVIETRLKNNDYEMTELIKTFYNKKLELLKNQINDHSEI